MQVVSGHSDGHAEVQRQASWGKRVSHRNNVNVRGMNNFLAGVEGSSWLKCQRRKSWNLFGTVSDNSQASYICKGQKNKAVWLFELRMNE